MGDINIFRLMTVHTEVQELYVLPGSQLGSCVRVNKALKKHKWVSLRPETFVPAFFLAKEIILYSVITPKSHTGTTNSMCHTLTHKHRRTRVEVIFRKHCLSRATGGKISRHREDGNVSRMMLRDDDMRTHCSLFMVITNLIKTT